MDKIKVSAVNYLNARPFLFGLKQSDLEMELFLDTPTNAAQKLLDGTVDMALAPITVIPKLAEHYLISDFCIGSSGAVRSVCIQSNVPMDQVTDIYMDYQSRASAALTKILMEEFWQKEVQYHETHPGYEDNIQGTEAALIIGDRAIQYEGRYPFSWDLGEAWQKLTGLEFVFAAWISRIDLPQSFKESFNAALAQGLEQLDQVISLEKIEHYPANFNMLDYFTRNISYEFNDLKKQGMSLFMDKIRSKAGSSTS